MYQWNITVNTEGWWEETAISNNIDTIKIKHKYSITCEKYNE